MTTEAPPLTAEQQEVWSVILDLYAAYMEGDRDRLESHLADGCTMWDSAIPELRTKADMIAARAVPTTGVERVQPIALTATEPVVRVWDETAYECHLLHAAFADPSLDERLRATSVMRKIDGAWKYVHHHEEKLS